MAINPLLLMKFYKKLKKKISYNFADGRTVQQPCQIKFKHNGVDRVARSFNIGTKCAPGWTSVSDKDQKSDTCKPNTESAKSGELPICSKSTAESWLKTQKAKSNPPQPPNKTQAATKTPPVTPPLKQTTPKPTPTPTRTADTIAPEANHNVVFKTRIPDINSLDEYTAIKIGKEFVDHYVNQFPNKHVNVPKSMADSGQVKSSYYAMQKMKEGLRLRGKAVFEANYKMEEMRSFDTSGIKKFISEPLSFGEKTEVDKGIEEVMHLTGGFRVTAPIVIAKDPDEPRGYAKMDFQIDDINHIHVGTDIDIMQNTVVHELGHHFETSVKGNIKSSYYFIMANRTGDLTSLNEMFGIPEDAPPDKRFRTGEKAYPGNWPNKYVGKVYQSEKSGEVFCTELISVMMEFLREDNEKTYLVQKKFPDCLNYIVGTILANHQSPKDNI